MAANKDGNEQRDAKGEDSFYSPKWLQDIGASVPEASLLEAGPGFYDSLLVHAISVDLEEPGHVVCTMRVPPSFCDLNDKLYGGAITYFVDVIGSAAIFATGRTHAGVSVEINVTFMAAAPLGEEIELEARLLRLGKTLACVAVDVRLKATGELVAQGRHTKFVGESAPSVARSKL